jgi:hypothetical protein
MSKWRFKLAAVAASIAFLAIPGMAGAHAAVRIPAAATAIIDGDGADLPIIDNGHGNPVSVVFDASTIFTRVSEGSSFELRSSSGLCLTNNMGQGNLVYMESCNPNSIATLWTTTPTHLIVSLQLEQDGITGNMTATAIGGCMTAGGVKDEGGHPLGCANQWTVPS